MIPETEKQAKRVCPGKSARHAYADPGVGYFTQSPQCWFSRGTAPMYCLWSFLTLVCIGVMYPLSPTFTRIHHAKQVWYLL